MYKRTRARPKSQIAARITEALTKAGLTQIETARVAQVPRDVVHKAVVRGSMPRDKEHREAVAKALNVSPSWLWFGVSDPRVRPIFDVLKANLLSDPELQQLIVKDDAFAPVAMRGDVLFLAHSYPAREGDRVYVRFLSFISPPNTTAEIKSPDPAREAELSEGIFRLVQSAADRLSFVSLHGFRLELRPEQVSEQAVIAGVGWR